MLLKLLTSHQKLLMGLGKVFCHLGNRLRRADTGHDILTLCVDEVFPVENIFSSCRIAGERHSSSRGLTCITKDHCLHVNSSSPCSGDTILLPIDDRTVILP